MYFTPVLFLGFESFWQVLVDGLKEKFSLSRPFQQNNILLYGTFVQLAFVKGIISQLECCILIGQSAHFTACYFCMRDNVEWDYPFHKTLPQKQVYCNRVEFWLVICSCYNGLTLICYYLFSLNLPYLALTKPRFAVMARKVTKHSAACTFSFLSIVSLRLTDLRTGQAKFGFDVFPIHLIHPDSHSLLWQGQGSSDNASHTV